MRNLLDIILAILMLFGLPACAPAEGRLVMDTTPSSEVTAEAQPESSPTVTDKTGSELPQISPGETAAGKSVYTDANDDTAIISAQFTVSAKEDEQTIQTGLVVIGPDGSEFVWVPTTQTAFAVRDFGSYMGASGISGFQDETELETYQDMVQSVEQYGSFYMGRFEASFGGGDRLENYVPASKRVTADEPGQIWIQFSPQDTTIVCLNLYADNDTVQGFFPWGVNYDTTLQWLIDSGCKTEEEVARGLGQLQQ